MRVLVPILHKKKNISSGDYLLEPLVWSREAAAAPSELMEHRPVGADGAQTRLTLCIIIAT